MVGYEVWDIFCDNTVQGYIWIFHESALKMDSEIFFSKLFLEGKLNTLLQENEWRFQHAGYTLTTIVVHPGKKESLVSQLFVF